MEQEKKELDLAAAVAGIKSGEYGIKETQDIISAAFTIVKKVVAVSRDGFQVIPDTIKIILDEKVRQEMADAANNAREAIQEIRELSVDEIAALFAATMLEVKDLLEFLRNEGEEEAVQTAQRAAFEETGMRMQEEEPTEESPAVGSELLESNAKDQRPG